MYSTIEKDYFKRRAVMPEDPPKPWRRPGGVLAPGVLEGALEVNKGWTSAGTPCSPRPKAMPTPQTELELSVILGDWDKLLTGGSSWVIITDMPQAQRNFSLREIQHIRPLQSTRRGCPEGATWPGGEGA